MSNSLWRYGLEPARLLCPWDSPQANTGVGLHAHLQGIPNPGIEPIYIPYVSHIGMAGGSLSLVPPMCICQTSLLFLTVIFIRKSSWTNSCASLCFHEYHQPERYNKPMTCLIKIIPVYRDRGNFHNQE